MLSHAEVHSVLGIVQIGMRRIDRYIVLYGHAYTSLYIVSVTHALQSAKEQRMMGHDEVTAQVYGLCHHRLRDVQTQ